MSLLGDIRSRPIRYDRAKTLIFGLPGSGKSTLAATIAEVGPTLFLYVPGEEGIGSLRGVDHEDNLTIHRLGSVQEAEDIYQELWLGEEHGFEAVVVDSTSALQTMVKKSLLHLPLDQPAKERPSTDYAFWGALAEWFTDFFTFWYALASSTRQRPIHVVMTAQTKMLEDAAGDYMMQPELNRGPLAPALSRPDQVLYTFMGEDPEDFEKQRHLVRVKLSSSVMAKTRCAPQVYDKLPEVLGAHTRLTLPKYLSILGVEGLTTDEEA